MIEYLFSPAETIPSSFDPLLLSHTWTLSFQNTKITEHEGSGGGGVRSRTSPRRGSAAAGAGGRGVGAATPARRPPPPPRGSNNNCLLASLIRLPFEILGTALTAAAAGLDLFARATSGVLPGPFTRALRGIARAAAALTLSLPSSPPSRGRGGAGSRVWRGGTATIGPAHSAFDGDDEDEFADPLAAAARFAASFREAFGDGGPAWAEAPWSAAADAASQAHKLCFVYLHAPRHDSTDAFCRETLCDREVSRRLSRECVCWGGDVSRSPEAHALAGALGARVFPFAALLVKCSPAASSSSSLLSSSSSITATLAARAEGPVTAAELGRLLDAAAAEHGPALAAAAAAAAGRERDRALRAEQDAEFEAALLADQAKARERERAAELERERGKELRAREEEAAARETAARTRAAAAAAALEERRAGARAALPREPPPADPYSSSSSSPSAAAAAIRVRLRDGSTHTRRFNASDQLEMVYRWVDSLEAHSSLRYSLVQSFPRAVLGGRRGKGREEDETMRSSLEELKLTPQAALFVQCGDDEE